jgi:TolB-like protein/class 3 adenylate cyclase/Tfp pilus assembly protein PilF
MASTRQLAAIMFTDIVGYTALMGDDEQKAFSILSKNRQLQKPIIEKFGGRWIKELGDGVMASFTTVSDAVNAAKEIQTQCKEKGEFSLRIGIHHGEIVFDDDDIFGDAVNVASRIQSIAPIGGIYVSESVHHNVANKSEIQTKFIKAEKLKNVKEPVRIYEILNNNAIQSAEKAVHLGKIGSKVGKTSFRSLLFILIPITLIISGLLYFINSGKAIFASGPVESIAVLPFVNETGLADMEYLSDGMTETLINNLSQIKELSVKARSSVFRYKAKDMDAQKAGNELSVQAILNGRVAQRGGNIILNLELVDVSTGNQIWGEQYNRKTTDLVFLQNEIAQDVSKKLQQKLTGSGSQNSAKNYTTNSEAYQLYLKGLFHWNKRTADDLKKAIDYFNQAKEKDPSFALAYAGLAVTYEVLPSNTVMTTQEAAEASLKAKTAALKALELDNTLAEPYAVLAGEKIVEWDFAGAENDYKRAIELNPNFATAHHWYSELLSRLGRHDEAIAEVKKAYELDPFSAVVNMNVGLRYWAAKRYDEAVIQFKKTIDLAPDFQMSYWMLGNLYLEKGMYEESLAPISKALILMKIETPESASQKISGFRQALKSGGKKGFWIKFLEEDLKAYKKGYISPVDIAADYAELGENDKAFEWLEKAYDERVLQLTYVKTYSAFDNLRTDTRYKDLLRRIGLPQ